MEYLMLLRGMRGARPGAYPAGRECVRLTQVAHAWLTENYGAKLVADKQAACRADFRNTSSWSRRGSIARRRS